MVLRGTKLFIRYISLHGTKGHKALHQVYKPIWYSRAQSFSSGIESYMVLRGTKLFIRYINLHGTQGHKAFHQVYKPTWYSGAHSYSSGI